MEYITSRRFMLPDTFEEMANAFWFNMWQSQQWPFRELSPGQILYWYETPTQQLIWRTRVGRIERFTFSNKAEAEEELRSRFSDFDSAQPYFVEAPEHGYCLAWNVTPIEHLNVPKPTGFRFPMLGWLRMNDDAARQWGLSFFRDAPLLNASVTDETTLDDLVSQGVLWEQLHQLNERMAHITPENIHRIVKQTIRRDTRMVRLLKEACEYRCQFPGCGVRIPKRDGGYYIEVAHIQAVARGGTSVLGNLLVLCPNHHKEFDYGSQVISDQSITYLRGELNGRAFEIRMQG